MRVESARAVYWTAVVCALTILAVVLIIKAVAG